MSRRGVRVPDWRALRTITPGVASHVHLLAVPPLGIRSRDLRRRVALGAPVRSQMRDAVCPYIAGHHLYQDIVPSLEARSVGLLRPPWTHQP